MAVPGEQATQLLADLVRIESVTPWLIPTGSGEATVAQYIADWLAGTGAETEIVEAAPGRPNVLARLRGTVALVLQKHFGPSAGLQENRVMSS